MTQALASADPSRERVRRWLLRAFEMGERRAEPVAHLVIKHVTRAGGGGRAVGELARIDVLSKAEREAASSWFPATWDELDVVVRDDAAGIGKSCTYRIYAVSASGVSLSRTHLKIDGRESEPGEQIDRPYGSDPDADDAMLEAEPANVVGLVAASQRHTEAAYRAMGVMMQGTLDVLTKELADSKLECRQLREERRKDWGLLEDALSKRHERELLSDKAKFSQKMIGDAYEQIKVLAPIVANRIAGRRLVGEPLSGPMAILKAFAESLEQHQIQGILSALSPAQAIAVLELLKTFAGPPGSGPPAAPANGAGTTTQTSGGGAA